MQATAAYLFNKRLNYSAFANASNMHDQEDAPESA